MLSVELADDAGLAELEAGGRADLLLSHPRAATLNIVNQRAAAQEGPVRIRRSSWMGLAESLASADPVRDLATPLKGPYQTVPIDDPAASAAAIRLAKLAGLLPAVFIAPVTHELLMVGAADVLAYSSSLRLRISARAKLPIEGAEDTEIVAFRTADGGPEHLALIVGHPPRSAAALTRLHSACLTGDVLGSLKCDCGPQLRAAIAAVSAAGGGIILYLQQEGRGIGLLNKLRAYQLQDQGFDTVDANLRLGFEVDEREFGLAARMLDLLGFNRVRLLTNNPEKVAGLQAAGIDVIERVPLSAGEGNHNAAYLATKRNRTGHLI